MESGATAAWIAGGFAVATAIGATIQQILMQRRSQAFQTAQKSRDEWFTADQNERARRHDEQLVHLQEQIELQTSLNTRWDPVRFGIYADLVGCAYELREVIERINRVRNRRRALERAKDEGVVSDPEYQAGWAKLAEELRPDDLKDTELTARFDLALNLVRIIASEPVLTRALALSGAIYGMRGVTTGSDGPEADKRHWIALEDFRDAVRVELGSAHYADPT